MPPQPAITLPLLLFLSPTALLYTRCLLYTRKIPTSAYAFQKEHTVKAHRLQAEDGGHQQRHHAQQFVDRLHCIEESIVTHCTEASASLQWQALFLASEFVRWAAGETLGRPPAAAPVVAFRIRQLRLCPHATTADTYVLMISVLEALTSTRRCLLRSLLSSVSQLGF